MRAGAYSRPTPIVTIPSSSPNPPPRTPPRSAAATGQAIPELLVFGSGRLSTFPSRRLLSCRIHAEHDFASLVRSSAEHFFPDSRLHQRQYVSHLREKFTMLEHLCKRVQPRRCHLDVKE